MSIQKSPSRIAAGACFSLAVGFCATAAADQATTASTSSVILRTATTMVKESANGKVGKQTGAGVMDTSVANDANGLIFMTWTDSVKPTPGADSGVQGAIALAQIQDTGLVTTKAPTALPALEGERTHMRPLAAIGENFLIDIFASEDNGKNNNPQAVAWVFDKAGNMLPIANTTRNDGNKPTNLIELSGKNDNQQYGPHSVCPLGKDGNGESFLVGVQRNNQQAYVMKVKVEMQGGQANVTVPYLNEIIANAQHNRPQVECAPVGTTIQRSTRVVTSVEANSQPADIGVRAVLVDVNTGKKVASKLIAASGKGKYAVQPSVAYISEDVVAIEWAQSANARGGRDQGRGHTGGENLSMLTTLKVSTGTDAFTKLDETSRIAPYQRHSRSFGTAYGAGAGTPAVAAMGGSSTGTGKGMVQMIPIDGTTGKIGLVDSTNLYEVSKLSDVANLPARGKRNPNDQASGFINGIGGLKNPGYGKANGFMPEVATFSLSAIPGLKDVATSTRDSLFLSLIPATWNPSIKTMPGAVTDTSDIKLGPSPTVTTAPAPASVPGATDPFGNPAPGSGGTDDGSIASDSSGCSMASAGKDKDGSNGFAGGLALVALGALLTIRRKRER